MKKIKAFITAMVLFGVLSVSAYAVDTQDVVVTVEIPQSFSLSWGADGSMVNLTGANAITVNDFINGSREDIYGGTLVCTSNAYYDLTVRANDNVFKGGTDLKPMSDLLVDIDNTFYVPLDGINEVNLITDHAAEFDAAKNVNYKLLLTSADIAGLYQSTLTYTIKASI